MTKEELEKHFTDRQIAWLNQNASIPQNATDEQILADFARQLYSAKEFGNSEKDMEHLLSLSAKPKSVFSVKEILSTVNPGAKTDTASVDQFIEDWNEGKVDDQAGGRLFFKYGPEAMNRADKVMKQAYADKQQSKPKVGTAAKVFGTIFAPRSLEAWQKGKDASWKDIGLDIGENLLMAAPIAGAAGLGAKALRLGKAGRILGSAAAAAVVPHTMELADSQLYNPEENLDRSVYNETDAALGTATNFGAPIVLGRTLGQLGRFLGNKRAGSEGAKGLSETALYTLDEMAKKGEWKKPTQETVDAVKKFNHEQTVGTKAESNVGKEATETYNAAAKKADEALAENKILSEQLNSLPTATDGNIDDVLTSLSNINKRVKANTAKVNKASKEFDKLTELQRQQMRTENKFAKTNEAKDYIEAGLLQKRIEDLEAKSKGMGVTASELLNKPNKTGINDILNFSKQLDDADWLNKMHFENPGRKKAFDLATQAAEDWAVNKYGSKRDAAPVLGGVSNLLQSVAPDINLQNMMQDKRKDNMAKAEKKYKQSVADKVIAGLDKAELTPDDTKYLDIIRKNPDVLKGMGEGNKPGFRNWYLLRGSDILRGTDIYRPTFDVE